MKDEAELLVDKRG